MVSQSVTEAVSHWTFCESINQSVIQSLSLSVNQSISLSVSQSFLQSITQLVGEYKWGKTYVQVHQIEFELEFDKTFL